MPEPELPPVDAANYGGGIFGDPGVAEALPLKISTCKVFFRFPCHANAF